VALRAFLVSAALVGTAVPRASRALDLPTLRAERAPVFIADATVTVDSVGHPSLGIAVSIPYAEMQWIKMSEGYAAGVELMVVIEPRHGAPLGDIWERRLLVPDFRSTGSQIATIVDRRSFPIPAGKYDLRVRVRDINGDETSAAHEPIEVPDFSRVTIGFSDLELGVVDSAAVFIPVMTRRFGTNAKHVAGRVGLFDRRPGTWPRTYALRFRILDDEGSEVVQGVRNLTVRRSALPIVLGPDSTDLFIGRYVFEIELVDGKSHLKVDRSFDVEESGAPRGRDFDRILEPLAYIADPKDIDALRNLPPAAREQGWKDFWRKRDPNPDTPQNEAMLEFLRRVRYAEEHFQGLGPGWRTDMGRIYIRLGPPDQTESRSSASQSSVTEIIWYYNRPYRRFVFIDRDGFGHYVLASPEFE
jgi:GWxTD domain-containing protein